MPRRASPACRPRHPCADRRQPRRIPRPPTLAAAQWPDAAGIYAGRDALAGGTWMGASSHGRYALVTNFREPGLNRADAPSRGALVSATCAATSRRPSTWRASMTRAGLQRLQPDRGRHGTSLVCQQPRRRAATARSRLVRAVQPPAGHALAQARAHQARLRRCAAPGPQPDLPALYTALADREPAADDELPATGLPPDREKLLSSPFIVSPTYGTRSSTVLALREHGAGLLHERRYAPDGTLNGESELLFELPPEYAGARTPDAVAGRNA